MEEISDIKRDFNIGKMCRTCLAETDDDMHEIFTNSQEEPDALSINQLLMQLAGKVQVSCCSFPKIALELFNQRLPNHARYRFNRTTDFQIKFARIAPRKLIYATISKPQSSRVM